MLIGLLSPIKFLNYSSKHFCSSSKIKKIDLYRKCFSILGVDESADHTAVRNAYIELVKKIHPDSGHAEASSERFQVIDEAFRILLEKFSKKRHGVEDDEEEKVFDIQHTVPQHRQYLSFDGIGVGTPFQREKQYYQAKAMVAQERVLNHRIEKSRAGEKCLMKKDGSYYKTHAIKTKYGFDRVVEDLIQEAMSKGDFNNLACAGKPLPQAQSQNPYLDFTTAKLNKIMLDNGFTPEWITLSRDIRENIKILKINLSDKRSYLGDIPLSPEDEYKWNLIVESFKNEVLKLNKLIDKLNLIVPILDNQMCRIRLNKLADTVLNDTSIQLKKTQISQQDANKEGELYKNSDFFTFLGSLFLFKSSFK